MTHLKQKDRLLAMEEVILQDNVRSYKEKKTLKIIANGLGNSSSCGVFSRLGPFWLSDTYFDLYSTTLVTI